MFRVKLRSRQGKAVSVNAENAAVKRNGGAHTHVCLRPALPLPISTHFRPLCLVSIVHSAGWSTASLPRHPLQQHRAFPSDIKTVYSTGRPAFSRPVSSIAGATATPSEPHTDVTVSIGDVSLKRPASTASPAHVPSGYFSSGFLASDGLSGPLEAIPSSPLPASSTTQEASITALQHLQWMMKKEALQQDVFLLGESGGPARRRLAFAYAEMMGREVEYICITRDTTESDLKQRRELAGGTSYFVDQAPVRAAKAGRILIIEGIERAERNVLPLLNNLLENREMALEDGSFLVSPSRWAHLVTERVNNGMSNEAAHEELRRRRLLRVHPGFRVIAIGLPVPPFPGRSLDPPLRSRFAGRVLSLPSISDTLSTLAPAATHAATTVATWVEVVNSIVAAGLKPRSAAGSSILATAYGCLSVTPTSLSKTLQAASPEELDGMADLVHRVYPYYFMREWSVSAQQSSKQAASPSSYVSRLLRDKHTDKHGDKATASSGSQFRGITADFAKLLQASGMRRRAEKSVEIKTVEEKSVCITPSLRILADGLVSELNHGIHVAIVGPAGCGKSSIARYVAECFNGETPLLFPLYTDMTARDLLQRRNTVHDTDATGKQVARTTWQHSNLIHAAINGKVRKTGIWTPSTPHINYAPCR
jgi:MoxR-like ATPase